MLLREWGVGGGVLRAQRRFVRHITCVYVGTYACGHVYE